MTAIGSPSRAWSRRTAAGALGLWAVRLLGLAVLIAAWRYVSARTTWDFVGDAPRQAADLAGRMLPPDWSYTVAILRPLLETIHIATLGTLLAIAAAIPLALLAARNATPLRAARPAALLAIVASRSINSLLWALLLVAILGPGALAGILAIALRSIGFVAKLLYEAVEEIDPAPVEAVASTGAGRAQVLAYAVAPQVMPALAGIAAFRWDINIREATIVGLVGAGGIGLQLDAAVSSLQWPRVASILLAILALVILAEWASARIRNVVT